MGGILAALIVFLFLRNWRSTIIAAVAIPTSIVATYTLMNAMGFTLDQITMLALVLMVGIVIDDAIVVLENVFRFMEEKKLSPMEAAMHGNSRHRTCGARDDAQPGDHLPACRNDERHRRQVHVELRLHGGICRDGVAARQLHADADAERTIPAAVRRRARLEGFGILPPILGAVPADARMVDDAPVGDCCFVGGCVPLYHSVVHDGREKLPPAG